MLITLWGSHKTVDVVFIVNDNATATMNVSEKIGNLFLVDIIATFVAIPQRIIYVK